MVTNMEKTEVIILMRLDKDPGQTGQDRLITGNSNGREEQRWGFVNTPPAFCQSNSCLLAAKRKSRQGPG